MARLPRIDLPGFPQHIIQRGNNRQACFLTVGDRTRYLLWLSEAAARNGCEVHAYVLMTNHVHLLATGSEAGALGHMMQSLGRRYVRDFNTRHGRSGTLWEGRFRSGMVDRDSYLLTCYRYIELNPVRAGLVTHPGAFRWSSFRRNANGEDDACITPHPTYLALAATRAGRQAAYRQLFDETIPSSDLAAIRDHVNQGRVLGSESFVSRIEKRLQRPVRLAEPGRPAKKVL